MSTPSRSTRPVIQPCSDSSCIRLSVRRKVDLPHPEGPMSACTRLPGKLRETPFTAANFPYMAMSLSVTMRDGVPSGLASACGMDRLKVSSAIQGEPPEDRQAGSHTQHEYHEDQDQGSGPGIAMPFLIGTSGVGEDGERQRRHRLVEIEAQILAAQGREQERRGFSRNAGDGQEGAGH